MSATPPPGKRCACGCGQAATTWNDDWMAASCATRYDNPGSSPS